MIFLALYSTWRTNHPPPTLSSLPLHCMQSPKSLKRPFWWTFFAWFNAQFREKYFPARPVFADVVAQCFHKTVLLLLSVRVWPILCPPTIAEEKQFKSWVEQFSRANEHKYLLSQDGSKPAQGLLLLLLLWVLQQFTMSSSTESWMLLWVHEKHWYVFCREFVKSWFAKQTIPLWIWMCRQEEVQQNRLHYFDVLRKG